MGVTLLLAVDANDTLPVADFDCPPPGTVFVLSWPLGAPASYPTPYLVKILGREGYDCHVASPQREYWQRVWLTQTNLPPLAWRAAVEEIWPLRVGNASHVGYRNDGKIWSIDYEVAAYEPFVAKTGTYQAFKVIGTLRENGSLVHIETRWWAPNIKYTLSYQLVYPDGKKGLTWEIEQVLAPPN